MSGQVEQVLIRPDVNKVLVIMNDHHLGNTVIALPVLEAFGQYFNQQMTWLIDQRYAPLVERLPHCPTVQTWPNRQTHRRGWRRAAAEAKTVLSLRRQKFDVSIDMMGMLRSTRITRWVAAQQRHGFGHLRNPQVYTHHVPKPKGPHCLDRYRSFLGLIQCNDLPELNLVAPDDAVASAQQKLTDAGLNLDHPLVVIHPSSAKVYRRWPAERFAQVADGLVDSHDANICLVGVPNERDLCHRLMDQARHRGKIAHLEPGMLELLALFNLAKLLVSSESGPTHLAAATNLPIVTIFGPSDENEWRPTRPHGLTVLRGAACDTACHPARCLHQYRCLMELSVDRVLEVARPALD